MTQFSKAHFESDGSNLRFTMPIAKVDEEKRIVSGFATLDNVDRQGDILLSDASKKAFENFRGNVRLMHQPIPAGKVVSFKEHTFFDPKTSKTYSGVFVDAYISKGAENVWQMILDGTLTGFSIGGKIVDFEPATDEETEQPIRIVKKYELMELSLVDSPANQFANILSIQKVNDEIITTGIATGFSVENIFWCKEHEIAIPESSDSANCVVCHTAMENIGWVESEDPSKELEIAKMVKSIMQKGKNADEMRYVNEKDQSMNKDGSGVVTGHADCADYGVLDSEGKLIGCYTDFEQAHTALEMYFQEEYNATQKAADPIEKETITNQTATNKVPEQGLAGGVAGTMKKPKKKVMLKRGKGDIEPGDFIAYPMTNTKKPNNYEPTSDPVTYIKGKVESIHTSGTIRMRGDKAPIKPTQDNPFAIVRLYEKNANNKYMPTKRMVVKELAQTIKLKPLLQKGKNINYSMGPDSGEYNTTPGTTQVTPSKGGKTMSSKSPNQKQINYSMGSSTGEYNTTPATTTKPSAGKTMPKNAKPKTLNHGKLPLQPETRVNQISSGAYDTTPAITNRQIMKSDVLFNLTNLVSQHNKKYGNVITKSVDIDMIKEVYGRGLEAYESNPGSNLEDVASAERWAMARVNGFLSAVKTGKFKRTPYDTDLLVKGHPLSTQNNELGQDNLSLIKEGGVEVADNVESPEFDTEVEEVEFEVEEFIEDIDDSEIEVEKADGTDAILTSELIDLEKALGDIKELVELSISKTIDSNNEGLAAISNSILELAKSVDTKVGQLQTGYQELIKNLTDLATRVDSVEEDTAIKKSGELEYSAPEQPIMRKSLWGGRFLNSAEIFN
jgi:hypothetical protein